MVSKNDLIKELSLLLICLLCLALYMYFGVWGSSGDSNYHKDLIKMNQKNDSLIRENQILDLINNQLIKEADSLNKLLENDRNTIQELKRKRSEKIEVIDNLDGDELLEFFSEFNTKNADTQW
ncbi:hypothetical protein QQ008_07735 [Fulvivirgaceae bacterium BMA10]|uniref:Uncharacterized protein n=1 Tax=Splendidivirga corallicola TaxID=3051826 RepID=A0ABT8KKK9_9BACT|nr:hypothetical protein [Fulvivirgaceae bacterium BMA10]